MPGITLHDLPRQREADTKAALLVGYQRIKQCSDLVGWNPKASIGQHDTHAGSAANRVEHQPASLRHRIQRIRNQAVEHLYQQAVFAAYTRQCRLEMDFEFDLLSRRAQLAVLQCLFDNLNQRAGRVGIPWFAGESE